MPSSGSVRLRQALILAMLFGLGVPRSVRAQASTAQVSGDPATAPANARITFVGTDRAHYALVEADFSLDNHPLATLNESADPNGMLLYNRELPIGDHVFVAELTYRRVAPTAFSNQTGQLLRVSGSISFHAAPGQTLSLTSRVQPRVAVAQRTEWLSLSTSLDSSNAPEFHAQEPDHLAGPGSPGRESTASASTRGQGSPQRAEPAPPPPTAAVLPERAPEEHAPKVLASKKTSHRKRSKAKGESESAAMLRLKAKLLHHAGGGSAKRSSPGGSAAALKLKSLLRRAAAKNE